MSPVQIVIAKFVFVVIDALIDPAKLPTLSGSLFWEFFWWVDL